RQSVAEQQDQQHRQDDADRNTTGVADHLIGFLPHQGPDSFNGSSPVGRDLGRNEPHTAPPLLTGARPLGEVWGITGLIPLGEVWGITGIIRPLPLRWPAWARSGVPLPR